MMESPITVLWSNIIHTFENINSSSLSAHQLAVKSGKISPCINYINDNEKVKTPSASLKSRTINIQETYLSHLWAFMYTTLVMHEEGIQKPMIDGTFNGSLQFDTPLLKRAKSLFDWSISLTNNYSKWDESLPNPKIHNCNKEKLYAEKVNTLFQDAVAFVMFHEFAHLTQNHDSFFFGVEVKRQKIAELSNKKNKSKKELSELSKLSQDMNELIQIENESDKLAFDALINQNGNDTEKLLKGISILSVYCSSLLIVRDIYRIKQSEHPDVDNRILNFLQQLNPVKEDDQFYCDYFVIFIIRLFCLKHNINLPPIEFETAQEALYYYHGELDKIKNE